MAVFDPYVAQRAGETLGERVRRRRQELRLSQVALAQSAGINQGYLSEIERDRRRPSMNTINALAVALDLPQGVLIGAGPGHDNPQPLDVRHLPMFGTIPAGPPAESQEQLQLFPVLRHMWTPDHYCLRLTYDSMEPTLKPGDVVLVHYRPDVDPVLVQGRICACLVDGEPTLKRVSVDARGAERVVVLRGDNPAVMPLVIDATRDLSIQGVVTTLVSRDL
ncbi:MAG: helix-turn-helix domain-containing protein [Phycisphaerales bacterium]|nr:helix-turn-helix domain-containing protein [Phycisphaerales bacterium]